MSPDYLLSRKLSQKNQYSTYRYQDDRDDRGWTLLHVGARKGDLQAVKRLLDEGMDANIVASGPRSNGVTPLHLAAKGGHIEVMNELLERGANIDSRTKVHGANTGWTPLHTAAMERNNKKAIKFLIKNGAFLPDNMSDMRFNPPVYYCSGLEWAYEEMKHINQQDNATPSDES